MARAATAADEDARGEEEARRGEARRCACRAPSSRARMYVGAPCTADEKPIHRRMPPQNGKRKGTGPPCQQSAAKMTTTIVKGACERRASERDRQMDENERGREKEKRNEGQQTEGRKGTDVARSLSCERCGREEAIESTSRTDETRRVERASELERTSEIGAISRRRRRGRR